MTSQLEVRTHAGIHLLPDAHDAVAIDYLWRCAFGKAPTIKETHDIYIISRHNGLGFASNIAQRQSYEKAKHQLADALRALVKRGRR